MRVSDVASAAWGYVRRAPGTFVWLAILFVTTVVMHHLSPQVLHDVLGDRSTNLHHLREDPIRVLVTSAFWIAAARGSAISCSSTCSTRRWSVGSGRGDGCRSQ